MQCVVVRCSALQCVAVCCSVLVEESQPKRPRANEKWRVCGVCVVIIEPSTGVCCSVLQGVAVCCSVLQCVAVCCSVLQCAAECCSVLQCVAVCCSVLQCVAVCCSVLPCDAGYRAATRPCWWKFSKVSSVGRVQGKFSSELIFEKIVLPGA